MPQPFSTAARRLLRWPEPVRAAYRAGARAMMPTTPGLAAWGLVTGIAMGRSALSLFEAIAMSLTVFAGSAQLASLPLLAGGYPVWTILLTATIVNLRFVIFSAGIQPHFHHLSLGRRALIGYLNGDLNFVLFSQRYPESGADPAKEAYFYGLSSYNWLVWQVSSLIGIVAAKQFPERWGLDFAGTLALLAILITLLVGASAVAAVLVAAVVAVLAAPLPYKLNLVLAVLAAIVVGVGLDELEARRSGRGMVPEIDGEAAAERDHILHGEDMPE